MASTNLPPGAAPRRPTSFAYWGATYKIALGVMGVGLFLVVWSPFVGNTFYNMVVTPLLDLLGAPADREFLPPRLPEAGAILMAMVGGCNIAVGVVIFCARLTLELLGLAGEPMVTRYMRPHAKLFFGTAAAAVVIIIVSRMPIIYFDLLFEGFEFPMPGFYRLLDLAWQTGRLLLVCSLPAAYFGWRNVPLLRWADRALWGKMGWGWLNRLALALIACGLVGAIFAFMLPFDDVAGMFATVGMTALILGIVPQIVAR